MELLKHGPFEKKVIGNQLVYQDVGVMAILGACAIVLLLVGFLLTDIYNRDWSFTTFKLPALPLLALAALVVIFRRQMQLVLIPDLHQGVYQSGRGFFRKKQMFSFSQVKSVAILAHTVDRTVTSLVGGTDNSATTDWGLWLQLDNDYLFINIVGISSGWPTAVPHGETGFEELCVYPLEIAKLLNVPVQYGERKLGQVTIWEMTAPTDQNTQREVSYSTPPVPGAS